MAARRTRQKKRAWKPIPPLTVESRFTWTDPRTGRRRSPPRPGQRFPKGTKPRRQHQYVQIDKHGRVVRIVEQITKTRVIKTSIADSHGSVDAPFIPGTGGHFPQTAGRGESGIVDSAIANTNVLNNLRGTRRVDIVVTGRDPRGRLRRFERVGEHGFLTRGMAKQIKDVRQLIVRGVLDMLRQKGFRTQYRLQDVDWRGIKPEYDRGGQRINSFTNVRGRTPLNHLDIQITLHK